MVRIRFGVILSAVLACLLAIQQNTVLAQGLTFRAAGPVNASMGGASTACPIDAAGALYWNPATMMGLSNSQLSAGLEMLMPTSEISSTLPNGMGGGTTKGECGANPVPAVALVCRDPGSCFAWGFFMGIIGGSKTNYAPSESIMDNPILCNKEFYGHKYGYGNLTSSLQLMQIAPSVAFNITENWSIGGGPTILLGSFDVNPVYYADGYGNPDGENGLLRGAGSRWAWGAGFQIGTYYDTHMGWRFGVNYKSQMWAEDFRMVCTAPNGSTEELALDIDGPAVLTCGVSYDGFARWLFSFDVRYFFNKAAGLDLLHWNDIFSFNFGIQHQLTERLALRAGYVYSQLPYDEAATRENLLSPLIPEHALFFGGSYRLSALSFHATYGYMFKNTTTGPYGGYNAAALGGSVSSTIGSHSVAMGVSVDF